MHSPLVELSIVNLCSVSFIICRFGRQSHDCGNGGRCGRGTQLGMDGAAAKHTGSSEGKAVSAQGGCFEDTPMVGPTRGLDSICKLMLGDFYIGRGVPSEKTGAQQILQQGEGLRGWSHQDAFLEDTKLRGTPWTLSGRRFVATGTR